MMTSKQAKSLLEIVKMAELQDWVLPSGSQLARRLWPDRDYDNPKVAENAARAANRRVESISKRYVKLVFDNASQRRLDPLSLATEPATAHYLLVFHESRQEMPLSKD